MSTINRVVHTTLPVTLLPCLPGRVTLRYAERCGAGSGFGHVEIAIPGLSRRIDLDVIAVRFSDDFMTTAEVVDGLKEMYLHAVDLLSVAQAVRAKYSQRQLDGPMSAVGASVEADGRVHFPCLVDHDIFLAHSGDGFKWRADVWDFLAIKDEQAASLHALLC